MHIEKKSAHSHHSSPKICRVTNPTRTIRVFSSQNSDANLHAGESRNSNTKKAYNHTVRALSEQQDHDVEHQIENIQKVDWQFMPVRRRFKSGINSRGNYPK